MFPILLFGIGNTLRSDDGVGIYVCEQLQQLQLKNVVIQTAQQLQMELVEEMFNYKVVFVVEDSIAKTEAMLLKNTKIMNMIILGAYLQKKPVVKIQSILEAFKKVLSGKYHQLLPINKPAFEKGASFLNAMKEPVI